MSTINTNRSSGVFHSRQVSTFRDLFPVDTSDRKIHEVLKILPDTVELGLLTQEPMAIESTETKNGGINLYPGMTVQYIESNPDTSTSEMKQSLGTFRSLTECSTPDKAHVSFTTDKGVLIDFSVVAYHSSPARSTAYTVDGVRGEDEQFRYSITTHEGSELEPIELPDETFVREYLKAIIFQQGSAEIKPNETVLELLKQLTNLSLEKKVSISGRFRIDNDPLTDPLIIDMEHISVALGTNARLLAFGISVEQATYPPEHKGDVSVTPQIILTSVQGLRRSRRYTAELSAAILDPKERLTPDAREKHYRGIEHLYRSYPLEFFRTLAEAAQKLSS